MIHRSRLTTSLAFVSCLVIAGVIYLQDENSFQYLFPSSWSSHVGLIFCSAEDKQKFKRLSLFQEAILLLKKNCRKATTLKEWQEISEDITYILIEMDKVEGGSVFIRNQRKKLIGELVEMGKAVDFEILS